ncbi:MAG: type II toxin-antitoxin system VapC family toxin, partial [Vicinamibacterales bacterium]
ADGPLSDVCITVVTKAELLYGVEVSPRRTHDAAALAAFLPYVETVPLDEDAAVHYAAIRADLKRRGTMIGANDLFIAAHARGARPDIGDEQHAGVRARLPARELDTPPPPQELASLGLPNAVTEDLPSCVASRLCT